MNYSPILSICTAAFELAAAGWAFTARGRKRILLSAGILLVFLAAYQIIEAVLCTDPARYPALGRVAFLVVLWLPATGLLLLTFLAPALRKFLRVYTTLFYAGALALFIWLLIDTTPLTTSVCLVVFARYGVVMAPALNIAYGAYYQLGLISMLVLAAVGAILTQDARPRQLIGQVLYGTLAFILPTIVVVNLFDITQGAFASILCHFALLLAVFIARLIWLEGRK
jgi:hypothetical protein